MYQDLPVLGCHVVLIGSHLHVILRHNVSEVFCVCPGVCPLFWLLPGFCPLSPAPWHSAVVLQVCYVTCVIHNSNTSDETHFYYER